MSMGMLVILGEFVGQKRTAKGFVQFEAHPGHDVGKEASTKAIDCQVQNEELPGCERGFGRSFSRGIQLCWIDWNCWRMFQNKEKQQLLHYNELIVHFCYFIRRLCFKYDLTSEYIQWDTLNKSFLTLTFSKAFLSLKKFIRSYSN